MSLFQESNLQKMRDFIKTDKETRNLKINNDKDIIIIYNYLHQKNKENNLGYKMILQTKPYISVVYKETTHSKQMNFENNLYKKNLLFNQNLNLDDIYQLKNFKYDYSNDKNKALNHIQKIIHNFNNEKKGCYLYGKMGTGKTFLLKCLTKSLIQKNIPVLFIFMPDLTRQFKNTWINNDIIEKKINSLKKTSCLILDDLGSENMNILFRDEIFYPILYYRYEHKLPIFFSSNFELQKLYEYLNFFKDYSNNIKATKIIRIIKELTYTYNFSTYNFQENKYLEQNNNFKNNLKKIQKTENIEKQEESEQKILIINQNNSNTNKLKSIKDENIEKKSLSELKILAKKYKIKNISKLKKIELINYLKEKMINSN